MNRIKMGRISKAVLLCSAALLLLRKPATAQNPQSEIVIGIFAPSAPFASAGERLAYISGLARAVETGLGGDLRVRGESFSSFAQLAQRAQFAIVDSVCAATSKHTVLATSVVGGATVQSWSLWAKGATKIAELKGKTVSALRTGCSEAQLLENGLLGGDVPKGFVKIAARDAVSGAVAEVQSGGAQAAFVPSTAMTRTLTKISDTLAIPSPPFVQFDSTLDPSLVSRVRSAVLSYAQKSAIEGFKSAENYGAIAGRLARKQRKPLFVEPPRIRLVDASVLDTQTAPPADLDLSVHFWSP